MKNLILLLSFLVISCGSSTADESHVKDVARTVILQNVKSMSTTEFYHNELVNNLGDSVFEYRESISATNSYGGAIDQIALVKVKWNGGDPSEVTNWSVLNVQFLAK